MGESGLAEVGSAGEETIITCAKFCTDGVRVLIAGSDGAGPSLGLISSGIVGSGLLRGSMLEPLPKEGGACGTTLARSTLMLPSQRFGGCRTTGGGCCSIACAALSMTAAEGEATADAGAEECVDGGLWGSGAGWWGSMLRRRREATDGAGITTGRSITLPG